MFHHFFQQSIIIQLPLWQFLQPANDSAQVISQQIQILLPCELSARWHMLSQLCAGKLGKWWTGISITNKFKYHVVILGDNSK